MKCVRGNYLCSTSMDVKLDVDDIWGLVKGGYRKAGSYPAKSEDIETHPDHLRGPSETPQTNWRGQNQPHPTNCEIRGYRDPSRSFAWIL